MNYFQPEKLEKALNFINEHKFVIAAGCTDLLPATENRSLSGNILDITNIRSLSGISLDGKYRRIGATTTWSEIVNSNLPSCYEMLKDMYRKEYSELLKFFYGTMISKISRTNGDLLSQKPEPFNILSLPIPNKKNPTLMDCLDLYTEEENLEGENQYEIFKHIDLVYCKLKNYITDIK